MIEEEYIEEYILSHIDREPTLLDELYRHTGRHRLYPRMCSGHLQGRLLAFLTRLKSPRRVLEIGTFSGYSALAIAEGLGPEGRLDTIEADDEAEGQIRGFFGKTPLGDKITLHIGDALETIGKIAPEEGWDMVFIDGNKREYCEYLEALIPHLRAGALLIADNTLWGGKHLEEAKDAQSRGIRAFNDKVAGDERFSVVILPLRDGLSLIEYLG